MPYDKSLAPIAYVVGVTDEKENPPLSVTKAQNSSFATVLSIRSRFSPSISTREAAEMYGIAVKRGGMACCPFHDDKHPSMKVDTRFTASAVARTGM